jgi:hypothetical protein
MEFFDRLTAEGVVKQSGRSVLRSTMKYKYNTRALLESPCILTCAAVSQIAATSLWRFLPFAAASIAFLHPHALQGLVMSDELHKAVAFEDCESYELFSPADRCALCSCADAPVMTLHRSCKSLFSEF